MQEVLFLALYMISTDTTQDVYRHVFRTMHVEDLSHCDNYLHA